jgi:hypothetical protein
MIEPRDAVIWASVKIVASAVFPTCALADMLTNRQGSSGPKARKTSSKKGNITRLYGPGNGPSSNTMLRSAQASRSSAGGGSKAAATVSMARRSGFASSIGVTVNHRRQGEGFCALRLGRLGANLAPCRAHRAQDVARRLRPAGDDRVGDLYERRLESRHQPGGDVSELLARVRRLDVGAGPQGGLFGGALVEMAKLRQAFGLDAVLDSRRPGPVEPGPAVGDALSDVEPGLELRLSDRNVDPRMAAHADDRLATNPALGQILAQGLRR